MKWTSALAIYLLFWAFSAFFVLPFHGRRASDDATPLVRGQEPGAPATFRPGRILLQTRNPDALQAWLRSAGVSENPGGSTLGNLFG